MFNALKTVEGRVQFLMEVIDLDANQYFLQYPNGEYVTSDVLTLKQCMDWGNEISDEVVILGIVK